MRRGGCGREVARRRSTRVFLESLAAKWGTTRRKPIPILEKHLRLALLEPLSEQFIDSTVPKMSEAEKYTISVTGYSFGAWLAEQCAYFYHVEASERSVR